MAAVFVLGLAMVFQNVLSNGSFETLDSLGAPVGWNSQTWAGRGTFSVAPTGHTGSHAVLVESGNGVDGGWQVRLPVKPYSNYQLKGWIKTEGVENLDGQGAVINLHSRSEHSKPIAGTTDWTQVSFDIDTQADDMIVVNCMLGFFGKSKGKAYFDDLEIKLVESRQLNPTATIDGSKRMEPISKYIYSQFIEHLGKCIYGGIWAEMLEDRKFYYGVGAENSPWHALGRGSATMSAKKPFVGEHSPVVTGGIAQGDLWVEKGRDYVGHIWLGGNGQASTVQLGLYSSSVSRAASQSYTEVVTAKVPATGWARTDFKLHCTETSEHAELRIQGGTFRVGTASIMPADNINGMRSDTIALLKELNAPLYRWPGGNFVSGYDWRDGIGDRDKRPPRKNPAWQGIEHNDFGTHEFLTFCKMIETEPLIVVNTGFGDAYSAASWLEYVNGAATTTQGLVRGANGHKEPWKVSWWGIGNEMYGSWQLGHIPLDQYIVKHNIFFDRMTKMDPAIKTIASSDLGNNWSKGMLTECGDAMTLISEHFYCQERPSVAAHVAQIPNAIRAKVSAHRLLRDTIPGLKEKHIKIAMDEWNYWYGPYVYGELGTQYFLKDALGIAAGLHEFYRSTDMVGMAQYAQTVNVIGAIKTTPIQAAFDTTGLVLKLYRAQYGSIPLFVDGTPAPLDVAAALTADGKFLTLSVVNPTADAVTLPLSFKSLKIADAGRKWEIADPDPMAYDTPWKPDAVKIVESPVTGLGISVEVKAYSATLIKVAIK